MRSYLKQLKGGGDWVRLSDVVGVEVLPSMLPFQNIKGQPPRVLVRRAGMDPIVSECTSLQEAKEVRDELAEAVNTYRQGLDEALKEATHRLSGKECNSEVPKV